MLEINSLDAITVIPIVFTTIVTLFYVSCLFYLIKKYYKKTKEIEERPIPHFSFLGEEALSVFHYFHNSAKYGDCVFLKANTVPEFFTVVEKRFLKNGIFATSHFTKMIAEIISINYTKGVRTTVVRYNGFVKETEDSNYKGFEEYWHFVDNKTNGWMLFNITQSYKNNKPLIGD